MPKIHFKELIDLKDKKNINVSNVHLSHFGPKVPSPVQNTAQSITFR